MKDLVYDDPITVLLLIAYGLFITVAVGYGVAIPFIEPDMTGLAICLLWAVLLGQIVDRRLARSRRKTKEAPDD